MHVRFSNLAETDIDHIHAYVTEHDPHAATRLIDSLLIAAYQLESFPFLGRPGRVEGTRELTVLGTSYFLVYTLPDAYHVDIERVMHSSRNYPLAD